MLTKHIRRARAPGCLSDEGKEHGRQVYCARKRFAQRLPERRWSGDRQMQVFSCGCVCKRCSLPFRHPLHLTGCLLNA